MNPDSQAARILDVLADGRLHSTAEIHRRAGFSRLNSRISELRKRGYNIGPCERIPGAEGTESYGYRLVSLEPSEVEAGRRLLSDGSSENGSLAERGTAEVVEPCDLRLGGHKRTASVAAVPLSASETAPYVADGQADPPTLPAVSLTLFEDVAA